jgi:hypothetical protein
VEAPVGTSSLIPAPPAVDIQGARPAILDTPSYSFDAVKSLFKPEMQQIMKALDQLRGHLKVQPDSSGTLKMVQSLISDTTKQSLLETLPGFNEQTRVYAGRIRDASAWVAENGDAGISISDMKEAHALNSAVERMCTGSRSQRSPYLRRPTFEYLVPSKCMYDPAGAAGGMYSAGAAGGIYPAGAAGGMYPAGAAGGMYPAGAAGGSTPRERQLADSPQGQLLDGTACLPLHAVHRIHLRCVLLSVWTSINAVTVGNEDIMLPSAHIGVVPLASNVILHSLLFPLLSIALHP